MPLQHPCIHHIDHCPAVIAAGGNTAARLREEVDRAEAERLRRAVESQAKSAQTLAQRIERSATSSAPPLSAYDQSLSSAGLIASRSLAAALINSNRKESSRVAS